MFIGEMRFHGESWDDVMEAFERAYNAACSGAAAAGRSFGTGGYTYTTIERPNQEAPLIEAAPLPPIETPADFVRQITGGDNWNGED